MSSFFILPNKTQIDAYSIDLSAGVTTGQLLQYNGTSFVAATVAAGVGSVSNSDGTLTISPTTGSIVASLALGHANTWSGAQTFTGGITLSTTAMTTNAFVGPLYGGSSTNVPSVTWTAVTGGVGYLNAWTDISGHSTQYYKDSMGMVHLLIAANHTSGSANPVLTLPSGYRPKDNLIINCANGLGTSATSTVLIEIGTNGTITPGTVVTNLWSNGEIIYTASF